ncbi:VOC family protein [Lysobacter enzymogenes]|uniref:3-demethylubiquinone-9 3-methyltransferase domain protein n=1 Tax=Lysobacter enzymogenes TaxID=69 RepID=A0A0S2DPF2_LYSEN|nr:VOC family protein [Lysobacter enzymogenes]ALN60426.1 3-demethylubiquinone-9 3-methyltransferase domain protein [Lysobacter enzymogenes]QCW28364.1 VOC family protein [Lysobacter enzymogenes]QQQ01615.1 VOC family protein [Lysobacter enzymogenes]
MQLTTYLSFDGDCREAFETYQTILGGKIHALMPFGDNPGCEGLAAAEREKIMHGCYELDGFMLMGTDATEQYPYQGVKGAHVTLSLNDPEQAARIFKALAQGGKIEMPLQETFWALAYGILTDRFGVPWMVNCVQAMGCVDGEGHGQAAA